LDDGAKKPIGYKEIKCHMIFDMKMDFSRKARFVAGGHRTDPPSSITYSSVVSRESMCITFTIAALNDLNVLCADIENAHLKRSMPREVYNLDQNRVQCRRRPMGYHLACIIWFEELQCCLAGPLGSNNVHLKFQSYKADPYVWFCPATKKDGSKYYDYLLIYVDNILTVSEHPKDVMETLSGLYRLKEDPMMGKTYDHPSQYLGTDIGHYHFDDDAKKR
jgi:hypothetical protein